MSFKRLKHTHYTIAGRDTPVVQVFDHRHSPTLPSKSSKAAKRKKRQPVTFRVEGSLHHDPNDSQLLSNDWSEQNMANPILEDLDGMFDSPLAPGEHPSDTSPGGSKKVPLVAYTRFDAELTVRLYAYRHQTTGWQNGWPVHRLATLMSYTTVTPLPSMAPATSVTRRPSQFIGARPVWLGVSSAYRACCRPISISLPIESNAGISLLGLIHRSLS
jgi:hypothetical protein